MNVPLVVPPDFQIFLRSSRLVLPADGDPSGRRRSKKWIYCFDPVKCRFLDDPGRNPTNGHVFDPVTGTAQELPCLKYIQIETKDTYQDFSIGDSCEIILPRKIKKSEY